MTGTSANAQGMKATGVNTAAADGAAGSVALSPITFKTPGTYEFQIREVKGKLGGVEYDTTNLTAKAEVSSDGKGNMVIAWSVYDADGNEITDYTYKNTYTAAGTEASLGAVKTLDGRALKDGEFTFQLKDEDGKIISEAKNAADGSILFDALSYEQTGTYHYTVSEVKGDDKTITYDEKIYNITVDVSDDLQGHLEATVTYEDSDGAPVFVNKYTEPPKDTPKDEGPTGVRTGDTAPILPLILAMAVSLAVIIAAAVLILRRRSSRKIRRHRRF